MIKRTQFVALCGLVLTARLFAGAIAPPYEYFLVHDPKGSPFVFVMKTNSGYCLRLNEDGKLSRSWSVVGWYSYPPDLSIDKSGTLLSRVHRILERSVSKKKLNQLLNEPLITFFRNGENIGMIKVGEIFTADEIGKVGVNSNYFTYKFIAKFKFVDLDDLDLGDVSIATEDLKNKFACDQQILKLWTSDNREICFYLNGDSIKKIMVGK